MTSGGTEAIVMDKDSTGMLWATLTQADKVYVTHSTPGNDASWIAPYVVPVSGANNLTVDDISAVVAYDGKIGVLWGNQNDWAYYFASHVDGAPDSAWTVATAYGGPELADDHMNIKSLQADPSGKVYAAVKTSLNGADDPLIVLLVLRPAGSWTSHVVGRVSDDHTRAMVLLDSENRNVYVFVAAPCCSGGVIYYKQSSMDNISFPPGLGTPFIQSSTDTKINNPTSTKQQVNSASDLVVLAGDDDTHFYLHNSLNLGPSGPTPTVTPPSSNTTLTFAVEADAHVAQANPTTNYGTAVELEADTSPATESYLRFTTSGIIGPVQSAKLRLYVRNGSNDGPASYGTGNSWTEPGISWNNRPARVGTATEDKVRVSTNTWVEYNVTSIVNGNGTHSFVLVPTSSDGADFSSRQATNNRPQLVVTFANPTSTSVPTQTSTSTPTETAVPTNTPTLTVTQTSTSTPTETPEATATYTPVETSTPTETVIPTFSPTETSVPTATPSATFTATPSSTMTQPQVPL